MIPLKINECLITKTVDENMASWFDSSFIYPETGKVKAAKWTRDEICGNGLHGYLNGVGYSGYANIQQPHIWLVLKVNKKDVVYMPGKVKFRCGTVIYTGDAKGMTSTLGNYGICSGIIEATKDDCLDYVGGHYSNLNCISFGSLIAGSCSVLRGEHTVKLTAGNRSVLSAGISSVLVAGEQSDLEAGCGSTLVGGSGSTFKAGIGSTFTGKYYDGMRHTKSQIVDGAKLKAGVTYRLTRFGKFERVYEENI